MGPYEENTDLKASFLDNNSMLSLVRSCLKLLLIASLSASCWQNIKVQLRNSFIREIKFEITTEMDILLILRKFFELT